MKYVYYPAIKNAQDINDIIGMSGTSYSFKVGEYVKVKNEDDLRRIIATFGNIFEFVDEIPSKEMDKQVEDTEDEVVEVLKEELEKKVKNETTKKPEKKGLLGRL